MTIMLITGALLMIAAVGTLGVGLYVGHKLTRPPRKPVDMQPEEFGLPHVENVLFPSREEDPLLLSGWYFSASAHGSKEVGMTLIFAHGYSQNRQEPHLPALSLAAKLVEAGYDVLMFDFRNAGKSGGNVTTVGYREKWDVLGAIDYAIQRSPDSQVGLIGFSMGAATALLAAAEEERVSAVVADSPFDSLRDYLAENMARWTGLPHIPFTKMILLTIPWMIRADVDSVNPSAAVEQMGECPILFIHGLADPTIPHSNSLRLFEKACPEERELWLVSDAGHVRSYEKAPEEYTKRVIAFLGKQLQADKQSRSS